jgi:hypothetical protein
VSATSARTIPSGRCAIAHCKLNGQFEVLGADALLGQGVSAFANETMRVPRTDRWCHCAVRQALAVREPGQVHEQEPAEPKLSTEAVVHDCCIGDVCKDSGDARAKATRQGDLDNSSVACQNAGDILQELLQVQRLLESGNAELQRDEPLD